MNKLFSIILILALAGCATASNLNNVSLGMTKSDVIKTLGNPASVSAKDNVEYLKYNFRPLVTSVDTPINFYDYYVRIVNGKVESYGKVGDFDSTKNPTADVNLNVKTEK